MFPHEELVVKVVVGYGFCFDLRESNLPHEGWAHSEIESESLASLDDHEHLSLCNRGNVGFGNEGRYEVRIHNGEVPYSIRHREGLRISSGNDGHQLPDGSLSVFAAGDPKFSSSLAVSKGNCFGVDIRVKREILKQEELKFECGLTEKVIGWYDAYFIDTV